MLAKDAAKRDAQATIDNYWSPGFFPVDVEKVALKMGMRIDYTYLKPGVSGMIEARPYGQPVIYVDRDENPARQRFTIAHELGHYVERSNLGQLDFAFIDERGRKYDIHEFYADEFAGNLLMPESEVDRLRRNGRTPVEMAAHFGVSPQAMNHRLKRLQREQ